MNPFTQIIILKILVILGAEIEYLLGKTKYGSGVGVIVSLVVAVATKYINRLPTAAAKNEGDSKMDIPELKAIVQFGFSVISAGKDIFVGGFNPSKLGDILSVYQAAVPAFQGLSQALPELEALTAPQIEELTAMLLSQGVANAEISNIISKSLEVAEDTYSLIKAIQAA